MLVAKIGMRVAITGMSGLIGRALAVALAGRGDEAIPVVRDSSHATGPALRWSTDAGFDPPDALSGLDAVVNLAGESVGGGRWTAARKRRILNSRVEGTRRVVEALAAAKPRPRVLLNASAVGYYGDRGDELLDENADPGDGFLSEVCQAWEAEAMRAADLGIRVVVVRTGFVLAHDAPALRKLAMPFRLGVGGKLGTGKQFFPWIHVDDLVRAQLALLDRDDLGGAFNLMAPTPSTNAELVAALGKVLRRPTLMPAPAFALRIALGEAAGPLVLHGQRAIPKRLVEAGVGFRFDDLEAALRDVLA